MLPLQLFDWKGRTTTFLCRTFNTEFISRLLKTTFQFKKKKKKIVKEWKFDHAKPNVVSIGNKRKGDEFSKILNFYGRH